MRGRVYFVLPKYSMYENKPVEEKEEIRKKIKYWYDTLVESDYKVSMFAEDFLAVEIFGGDTSIKWQTIVNDSDIYFLLNFVDGVPKNYFSIAKKRNYDDLVQAANLKYKNPKAREIRDNLKYRVTRLNALRSRLRYVASSIIDEADNVIFIDDGKENNFCNPPKPESGDGKMIAIIELRSKISYCYYGGIPLQEDIFLQVLKGR